MENEIYYNLPESTFRLIKTALEAGLEHSRTALAEHERSLGRTTRKNELWAQVLEKDIKNLEESLNLLPASVTRPEEKPAPNVKVPAYITLTEGYDSDEFNE